MIRIFGPTDKIFASNGDAVVRPHKAIVHKEDNDAYYLDLEAGLEFAGSLAEGNIIVATTPQGDQAFRVANPRKTKSKVSVRAKHVSYDSTNYLIEKAHLADMSCGAALAALNAATEPASPFEVDSDIETLASIDVVRQSYYEAIRAALKLWGGHLVRDNFRIGIRSEIGQDNGVTVRYAKNLQDITCEEDWDGVVTQLLPTGKDGIMLNALDPAADIYVRSATQYAIPYTRTVQFSQSIDEDDYKNGDGELNEQAYKQALVEDLRRQAQAYVDENCAPRVYYSLKANIERLTDVGDTIEVMDERLGLRLMTRVIAFDYDCNLRRYTNVEFGNFKPTLSGFASSMTASMDGKTEAVKEEMTRALQQATEETTDTLSQSAVTRSLVAQLTDLTAEAYTTIPLTGAVTAGQKLTATSDGVKIGKGVHTVLVSGTIAFSALTAGERRARILRGPGGTVPAQAAQTLAEAQTASIVMPPILAEVQENDVLRLQYYTPNTGDTIGGAALTVVMVN